MISNRPLRGIVVEGDQGELLGQIESTYVGTTGEPTWATASNGGQTELVSLDSASYYGAVLRLRRGVGDLGTHPTDSRPGIHRAMISAAGPTRTGRDSGSGVAVQTVRSAQRLGAVRR